MAVRECYQLLPEMALDLAEVTLVVFVDADARGLPGSIEIHDIDPVTAARTDADARGEPGASSHHVGGGELLALAAALTGRTPEAVAIGIGGMVGGGIFAVLGLATFFVEPAWGIGCFVVAVLAGLTPRLRH